MNVPGDITRLPLQSRRSSLRSSKRPELVQQQQHQLARRPGPMDWWDCWRAGPRAFNRLREAEVIHARWAMLGVLGLILSDTSVADALLHPGGGSQDLPPWFALGFALIGLLETYRLAALWDEQDFDARTYPGKQFDVLGVMQQQQQRGPPPGLGVFSSWVGGATGWLLGGWWWERPQMTRAELEDLKSKELVNGRLALVSFMGCALASLATGKGPVTLLAEHLADPVHNSVLGIFS